MKQHRVPQAVSHSVLYSEGAAYARRQKQGKREAYDRKRKRAANRDALELAWAVAAEESGEYDDLTDEEWIEECRKVGGKL